MHFPQTEALRLTLLLQPAQPHSWDTLTGAVTVKGSPVLAMESAQGISLLTFPKVSMEFRAGCARGKGGGVS